MIVEEKKKSNGSSECYKCIISNYNIGYIKWVK